MPALPDQIIIDTEKLCLQQVSLVKGWLNATDEYVANPQQPEGITFQLGHRFGINRAEKTCRFLLEIKLEGVRASGEILGVEAAYTLDFHFLVDNFEDYVIGKGKRYHLHPMLGATLLGIAFSTSRGIILERIKGSYLDGIILPVISPMKFLFDQDQVAAIPLTAQLPETSSRPLKKKG